MKLRKLKSSVIRRIRAIGANGQTIALVVILMPALIGAVGLAVDVGNFYFNYYEAQAAVDASAIAGATCLAQSASCTAGASTVATTYATKNDTNMTLTPNPVAPPVNNSYCPSPLPACQVTVSAKQTVPYYFARLVGADSGLLKVTATATGGAITSFDGSDLTSGTNHMMPIGLDYTSVFSNNNAVNPIAYKFSAGPGNWGFLALGGSGDTILTGNIQNGYAGKLTKWDGASSPSAQPDMFVTPKTGVGTAFKAMNDYRYAPCTGQTATDHPPDSPCAICVPLVDWSYGGGCTGSSCSVPIMGFAEMWVDSVTPHGSSGSITATWITSECPGGSFSSSSSSTVANKGAIKVQLVQ